jgi:hypothetical protein
MRNIMNSKIPRIRKITGLIFGSLIAQGAWAIGGPGGPPPPAPMPEEGNVYYGYVEDQELYDDNLFRIPGDGGLPPGASKSDFVNTVSAGGYGQWYLGRQLFDANVRVLHSFYARNDALENTGGDANLQWNWLLGSSLSGKLGAEYQHGLASFAETLYTGRDLVDAQNYSATGRYQIGPHWALEAGTHESKYTHSAESQKFNNLQVSQGNVGVEFDSNVADSFTLEYQYTDGKYPGGVFDTFNGVPFSPNYHDSSPRLNVKYQLSEKTSLSGYAGYLKRTYQDTDVGAFSGDVWRIEGLWNITEKTQLTGAVYHELHAYLAAQANYFVAKGVSLAPVWVVSDKLSTYITLAYEDQDYIPSSTDSIVLGRINAKSSTETISAVYTPIGSLVFNFLYQRSQRSSNQDVFRYGDNYAYVSAAFRFH